MELNYTALRSGELSSFLRKELQLSSGLMNRLKWHEKILVNGIPRHTNYPVVPGNVITVILDEEQPGYPPQDGPVSIIYEDAWILAVDKPAGMLIHPSRNRIEGTLANYVLGYYLRTGQKSAFHPVTRLDRDTFGIVLLSKNSHMHDLLQKNPPQKTYHALVYGAPAQAEGTVDAPIARMPLPSLLREIRKDGKPSVTEYRTLETFPRYSRLELRPITGRTHQLRLHCRYLGCPILGDPQYASKESQAFSHDLFLETQVLCAKKLEFIHPITKKSMVLESTMDAEL